MPQTGTYESGKGKLTVGGKTNHSPEQLYSLRTCSKNYDFIGNALGKKLPGWLTSKWASDLGGG